MTGEAARDRSRQPDEFIGPAARDRGDDYGMKELAKLREQRGRGREIEPASKPAMTLHDAVLELQRTAGNRALGALLGGHSLDPTLRASLEERYGADLSHVRLYDDVEGARRALSERAAAVTTGADVSFAPGRYQPETEAGRTLIEHEVAHVVQHTRNADGLPLGVAELEAEAADGGPVVGRAAAGTALRADDQILQDAKREELKRILTADKDAWMDYLDHPVYSQILHDDLDIGRGLVADPRFRRWLDDPSYRPKEIAKVTPATKPIQATPTVEQTPLASAAQRNWGKEWERMSGAQRARNAYEDLVHPSQRTELPPIPVYYTREMAELDAMPGVLKHVPGAEIGWRSAELAWGEKAGTGLEIDRKEAAKELAFVVAKEVVMSWAAGRVVKGASTLDELRSAALAADEAAKLALRPGPILGRVPVRGPSLVRPPAPPGAGATVVKSPKPSPWKAPSPSFKSGGGGVRMQLQPESMPQPGGGGVGVRPNPVFEPTPGTTPEEVPSLSDRAGKKWGGVGYGSRPLPGAREEIQATGPTATPPALETAPGLAPASSRAPTIWLPGLGGEDVEAPPAERREPISEKETPPPIHIDPKPEPSGGRIDPMPEGRSEPLQLASSKKAKAKKKSEELNLEGDPSDPTPVMHPAEEARYTQYSPEVNREAKFRRQFMQTPPKGGGTIKSGHTSRTWDEQENLLEESTTLLEPGVRDQQALQGLPGAKPGDEAGHLLRIAFGHVDAIWGKSGVVPQARSVNTGGGEWWKAENEALKKALARDRAGLPYRIRAEAKGFKNRRPSHTRISVEDENAVPVYDSGWIANP
jgi:hypothetical protein